MAKTKSAKKANRVSLRRKVFNARHKKAVKDSVKDVAMAVRGKNASEAGKAFPLMQKAIDKAVKHGTLKKNTASRMKARLAKQMTTITK